MLLGGPGPAGLHGPPPQSQGDHRAPAGCQQPGPALSSGAIIRTELRLPFSIGTGPRTRICDSYSSCWRPCWAWPAPRQRRARCSWPNWPWSSMTTSRTACDRRILPPAAWHCRSAYVVHVRIPAAPRKLSRGQFRQLKEDIELAGPSGASWSERRRARLACNSSCWAARGPQVLAQAAAYASLAAIFARGPRRRPPFSS